MNGTTLVFRLCARTRLDRNELINNQMCLASFTRRCTNPRYLYSKVPGHPLKPGSIVAMAKIVDNAGTKQGFRFRTRRLPGPGSPVALGLDTVCPLRHHATVSRIQIALLVAAGWPNVGQPCACIQARLRRPFSSSTGVAERQTQHLCVLRPLASQSYTIHEN